MLSVGYRPAGFRGALPDDAATNPAWQAARAQVLALIAAEGQKADPTLTADKLVAFEESVLPVLDVTVHQFITIKALRASGPAGQRASGPAGQRASVPACQRASGLVRYAEPMG